MLYNNTCAHARVCVCVHVCMCVCVCVCVCGLPSFALLDYRVTNQIYLSLTRNTSSAKLGNQAVPNEAL